MSDEIQDFNAGAHSFYGMMQIKIISGSPVLNGATLYPGFIGNIFAPLYNLPLTMEATETFKMIISPLPENQISKREYSFYFPKKAPDGFKQLARCIFYSPMIHGAAYPIQLIKFIDQLITKKPTKIFVAGNKGVGKSSLSRLIANKILSVHGKVGFLDLDPGQPEFSLPGTVSFSVLSSFVLEPPERHTKVAQVSYYYGGASVTENITHFQKCIQEVVKNIPSDMFVIINSFGWVVDLGLELHKSICDLILPENLIMLTKPSEQVAPIRGYMFKSEITSKPGIFTISPKEQREVRIIAYLTSNNTPFSSINPIAINLRTIHIGLICVDVEPTEILTALNGSIVALCNDTRNFAPNKKLVTILREVPPLLCQGFGLVRAIDKANGMLYIITDVAPDTINTVIMGAINTPVACFLDTPCLEGNYLGIGLLDKIGASTDPLTLKKAPIFE